MIAQQSAIQLNHFAVLQSHYEFEQPKKSPKNVLKLFQSYEIDIDFAHHEEEEGVIRVFVKIGINQVKKTIPGYKLLVEGIGLFHINDEEITEQEKNNLKFFSSVSIMIGYLRNSLTSITSSAPLGSYLLPPIDMGDLLAKKSKSN